MLYFFNASLKHQIGKLMAIPFDPKEIVTVQELAVCNMLELETLSQLLFEKGIIGEEGFWLGLRSLMGR